MSDDAVEFLTEDEHEAMRMIAELVGLFQARIIGDDDRTRSGDVNEFVYHVHGIQHMIMSQAAARAYPDQYRLLGEYPWEQKK